MRLNKRREHGFSRFYDLWGINAPLGHCESVPFALKWTRRHQDGGPRDWQSSPDSTRVVLATALAVGGKNL